MPCSAEELYGWHERPGALERLAPPWERARVVARTGGIANGSTVTLEVHAGPVAVRWVARHRDVVPGRQFVDEQVHGPFASWVHLHRMIPVSADQCELEERIEFTPPFGPLGAAAVPHLRQTCERLLAYRHRLLADDMAAARELGLAPMHVVVTGASGLIGSAVVSLLGTGGHQISRLVRRPAAAPGEISWDPARGSIDSAALEGVDAVVHLAGEGIAERRWSTARKQAILTSRTEGTRLLASALAGLARRPRVLISASAVGIYGDRRDELLDESSEPGRDFLANVCQAWEAAADPARAAGIRVVHPRFGVVLSPGGGALARLLPPFRAGVGGPIGGGSHWMSTIAIDDAAGAIQHILAREALAGPVNVAGPEPVRNADFTRLLARILRRPAVVPVPAAALRVLFGELADAALLASQRVDPAALRRSGYVFRHRSLEDSLRFVLGRD
ncbi:MAG: TIGR01777 family protein [Gemmatimonadales bacterium]|nr:TIGR01777 family protein [Gemmatimonadales bacterium]